MKRESKSVLYIYDIIIIILSMYILYFVLPVLNMHYCDSYSHVLLFQIWCILVKLEVFLFTFRSFNYIQYFLNVSKEILT
jgi:hypothetical protein